MIERIVVQPGIATSNHNVHAITSHATAVSAISSATSYDEAISFIPFPETEAEREDRKWERTFNSARGLHILDFLLAEARCEIDAGEFEEGGFGLE